MTSCLSAMLATFTSAIHIATEICYGCQLKTHSGFAISAQREKLLDNLTTMATNSMVLWCQITNCRTQWITIDREGENVDLDSGL